MNQSIEEFIKGKRVAVVGVSHNDKKFGSIAYQELKKRGYQVVAVNPNMTQFAGDPCYPNLLALQGKIDGVVLCVPSTQGEKVLREAAQAGIKNVWLQAGAQTPGLVKLGRELNLNLVAGKCILMYATPVTGFHGWHRGFVKFFGKL
jgi:predicted CoA-binding protein